MTTLDATMPPFVNTLTDGEMVDKKEYFTTRESAEWLIENRGDELRLKSGKPRTVSSQTILQWIWDDRLKAQKLGNYWMVHIDELRKVEIPELGNPDL